ncbi:MAG: hypothetical protein IID39_09940, partial [Planctomycetes bacterium]|nr:hypothetical protein [Planctomycetota bacterium]
MKARHRLGLRDLRRRLRQQRRERLDQFDLGGVMEDLRKQLDEILKMERDTIDDRMPPPPEGEAGDPAAGENA